MIYDKLLEVSLIALLNLLVLLIVYQHGKNDIQKTYLKDPIIENMSQEFKQKLVDTYIKYRVANVQEKIDLANDEFIGVGYGSFEKFTQEEIFYLQIHDLILSGNVAVTPAPTEKLSKVLSYLLLVEKIKKGRDT